MSFCWDEREHRERAREDARWYHQDYEYYDRYTSDPCKQAYTEEYDDERRRIYREEEERQEREAEEARAARCARERREMEEYQEQYAEQYPEPDYPDESGSGLMEGV